MISDAVIEKLSLQLTNDTVGLSRLYKCRIFIWQDLTDAVHTVYLMECELDGTPALDKGTVFVVRGPRHFKWCRITNELLGDLDADQIMKAMQHQMSKCPDLPHNAKLRRIINPNQG